MKYFFNTQLGNSRFQMSDGGMLCRDVPIARTGEQTYTADDLPDIEPSPGGLIVVERHDDEVFSDETLASFEGMSITIDHPHDIDGSILFINPDNWRELSFGHVQNVRRGEGINADLILADLVVKSAEAIQAIEDGLREVSCGYDAHYEQISQGRAKQVSIRGNHVALVDKGRAGSRCAIGDRDSMQPKKKAGLLALLARAVKTGDADDIAELAEMASGDSETPPNYSLPPQKPEQETPTMDSDRPAWVDELLTAIKGLSPKTGDSDEDDKTGDSDDDDKEKSGDSDDEDETTDSEDDEEEGQVTGDSAYRADLIVPGFDIPKKAKPTAFKRDVLGAADKQLVRQVVGDSAISNLPKQAVDMAFNAVSEIAKSRNTRGRTTDSALNSSSATPASLNQAARDFWSKK
ncbi:DUF2213 domain-containing protein [Rosenbergiella nectarea]|uniref:DUF2213 domain-containing protein n=1 Tax=Rosenbergiella nectarea TaxID=988801 RepID=UPI001F4EC376|nr:DUF2213 domain-containing protein [Rosenbergiella nectarea]